MPYLSRLVFLLLLSLECHLSPFGRWCLSCTKTPPSCQAARLSVRFGWSRGTRELTRHGQGEWPSRKRKEEDTFQRRPQTKKRINSPPTTLLHSSKLSSIPSAFFQSKLDSVPENDHILFLSFQWKELVTWDEHIVVCNCPAYQHNDEQGRQSSSSCWLPPPRQHKTTRQGQGNILISHCIISDRLFETKREDGTDCDIIIKESWIPSIKNDQIKHEVKERNAMTVIRGQEKRIQSIMIRTRFLHDKTDRENTTQRHLWVEQERDQTYMYC